MNIQDIKDPVKQFIAFIEERENIRLRRIAGKPWPWTKDEILQTYRFTNVHREDDAVSQHFQNTVRNRYGEDPRVFPGTIIYRWFNRPSTCDAIFNKGFLGNKSRFEVYIEHGNLDVLLECIHELPRPHVTGAYIINGKPGYSKAEGVLQYIHEWCSTKPWQELWEAWKRNPPLLSEIYACVLSDGLGSFMRGQIVADLKYVEFLRDVRDWWMWATPGPGSLRGLNIVLGRHMMEPWGPKGTWLAELIKLSDAIAPELENIGIGRLHNQDLQNCLCEFFKYTKTARGAGRPRQVFHHV
jgi:5-hmdU DNA kinase, helical domain